MKAKDLKFVLKDLVRTEDEKLYVYYDKIGDALYKQGKLFNAEKAWRKALDNMRIQEFKVKEYSKIQKKINLVLKEMEII